jgi:serine O-acetyltransferase
MHSANPKSRHIGDILPALIHGNPPIIMPEISASEPDWSRERPGRGHAKASLALLASIRAYQAAGRSAIKSPIRLWAVVRHRFWSIITGAEIPLNCKIGGGLLIPHPNGIVIHHGARIGVNCLIHQQVTIGLIDTTGLPIIGGHVDIGAGAKILGPVTIGDHARIGANAVVLCDVPAGATAVGIPARILSPR